VDLAQSVTLFLVTVAVLLNGGAILAHLFVYHRRSHPVSTPDPTTEPVPITAAPVEVPAAGDAVIAQAPPVHDPLVRAAPMVEGVTLREWLVHHHPLRDGVWRDVVTEFYRRAALVPAVASYFGGTNMARLNQHFTRALVIVAGEGITESAVARLRNAHAVVVNAEGVPITGAIYDAVVDTLVAILAEQGVPRRGIAALAETIGPLREVIVREPCPHGQHVWESSSIRCPRCAYPYAVLTA
jgi:hypothetical protein